MPQAERLLAIAGRLQARAQPLRPPELHPFVVAGHTVGWAAPEVARFLVTRSSGFEQRSGMLHLVDDGLSVTHRSALLADAAILLRNGGLLRGWRDEALAVRAHPGGEVLATVERAACRALGIMTEAVHLNAFGDDGTLLVARRAADKALEREAWEEAGLELDRLEVHHGRSFHVRRPVAEGYQSERIYVYEVTLSADTTCSNQDGEVAAIERRSLPAIVDAIERDEFTLEAALATLESLARRGGFATPPGLYE
jgi:8-oxo-dGTP pyrophosphatase MutT (NUDIX family)